MAEITDTIRNHAIQFYSMNRRFLQAVGVKVEAEASGSTEFAGIPTPTGAAKVVLKPSFGVTQAEIASRFPSPEKVSISSRSTLVLSGDITIESLTLDGALELFVEPGASLTVSDVKVVNAGCTYNPVSADDESVQERFRIRGYRMGRNEVCSMHYGGSTSHVLSGLQIN